MHLVLVFDHRFYRGHGGAVHSLKAYDHSFFARRYLQVFEHITILCRLYPMLNDGAQRAHVEGAGVSVRPVGDWDGLLGFLAQRRRIAELLPQLMEPGVAVIMVAGMLSGIAAPGLIRAGRPYGLEVVGDPLDTFSPGAMRHPLRPVIRRMAHRQLKAQCRAASAVAYVTRDALQRRYPCGCYSVGVSDVDVQMGDFVQTPRVGRTPGPLKLVTIGTLANLYKGPDVLIDAIATCVARGTDVKAVWIGDGRFRDQLIDRAQAKGVADRLIFRGVLPAGAAIHRELDAADVFILPSYQEGLPRAMVEAMARGLPCVGSAVGGIPELLEPENLVPAGDARALARRIRDLAENPARLTAMSAANLARAAEYRDDILQRRRLQFYDQVKDLTEAWMRT